MKEMEQENIPKKAIFRVNTRNTDMNNTYQELQPMIQAATEANPYSDAGLGIIEDIFGMTLITRTVTVLDDGTVGNGIQHLAVFNTRATGLEDNGYISNVETLKELLQKGYKPIIIGDGSGSGVGRGGAGRIDVMMIPMSEEEQKEVEAVNAREKLLQGPTVEDAIAEVVAKGYCSQEDADARVAYMRSMQCIDKHIVKILQAYQKPKMPISKPKKLYVDVADTGKEPLIKKMIRNIVCGHNVILEGPKSVGKNVAWETIGWLTNKPVSILKMSAQITKDEMLGTMTSDNASKDALSTDGAKAFLSSLKGKDSAAADEFLVDAVKCASTSLKFQLGILAQWLVDGDGILILDEMNLALANTLSATVNSLADDHTQWYEIPGYGVVQIPEGCILGGTQNDSSYIGTQSQNEATYSRFMKIILESPNSILPILKAGNPGATMAELQTCDEIFSEIRSEGNESLDPALSIRGFIAALENVVEGEPLKEALEEAVVNHIEDPEDRQVVMDILNRKIAD